MIVMSELHSILYNSSFSLATAESCTGGNIAAKTTLNGGSSKYFFGSLVSYSNTVKEDMLKISKEDIKNYGVVSETVAIQMASGVRDVLQTDYAISTTGIAGPTGGTINNPVGTVWIGFASDESNYACKFEILGDRKSVIYQASEEAFKLLIKELKKDLKKSI
jgi:nicotinamide-nucleotide amidase